MHDTFSFFYESMRLSIVQHGRANAPDEIASLLLHQRINNNVDFSHPTDLGYESFNAFVEQVLAFIQGRRARKVLYFRNDSNKLHYLYVKDCPLQCSSVFAWQSKLDFVPAQQGVVNIPNDLQVFSSYDNEVVGGALRTQFWACTRYAALDGINQYVTNFRKMIQHLSEIQASALIGFFYFHVYKTITHLTDENHSFSFKDSLTMIMRTSKNAMNPVSVFVDPCIKNDIFKVIMHKPGRSIVCDSYNTKLHLFYNPEHRISITQYVKYNDKKIFKQMRKYLNNAALSLLPAKYLRKMGELFPKIVSDMISQNAAVYKKLKLTNMLPVSNEVHRHQG